MGYLNLGEIAPITTTELEPIKTALTDYINVGNIVTYLAYGIGACIVLVLFWFGVRKLVSMVMGAFRKGKFRV